MLLVKSPKVAVMMMAEFVGTEQPVRGCGWADEGLTVSHRSDDANEQSKRANGFHHETLISAPALSNGALGPWVGTRLAERQAVLGQGRCGGGPAGWASSPTLRAAKSLYPVRLEVRTAGAA